MFDRYETGIPRLDEALGGGLLPGTLTVVLGATGIGKTQLGLQFASRGAAQEGERGILFDMTARGDSQNHAEYARRLCGWSLRSGATGTPAPEAVWDRAQARVDSLHLFRDAGRRVIRQELNFDEQREWQAELNRKLARTVGFFYGNFLHGVRRCVIDGIEPAEQARDSVQLELFEYIYEQILRKESSWVARDHFRESFRAQQELVARHAYDHHRTCCVLLCTTKEVLLDDLIARPLEAGDLLANANTILLMGKVRDGDRVRRALHIAKHRGSACEEAVLPFEIDARGLTMHAS
jgi:KaiC/GvpD/RAD55 family RecA-like ATPase